MIDKINFVLFFVLILMFIIYMSPMFIQCINKNL